MSKELREIRINPVVPSESVLIATARGSRPRKAKELAPHDPRQNKNLASYHTHLEITPRTSIPTSFELGSVLFVNAVSPKEAAEKLRNAEI